LTHVRSLSAHRVSNCHPIIDSHRGKFEGQNKKAKCNYEYTKEYLIKNNNIASAIFLLD